ncbi:hypothetical protein SLEP1_g52680 [Rubroshorea leprosula]|uniref:ER membrane protein complex subunit 10 n=1 Tax=Rubroshorea leprosula TaxID=152421 RepID=A0AAV5M767_9ROSI|nr:hypothetical protein SLEP1_g52680 [Rubroshorea leprosula]
MTRSSVSRVLHLASLNQHPSLLLLDLPGRGIRSWSLTPRSSLWGTLSVTPIWFPLAPSLPAATLGITVASWLDVLSRKFQNLLQGDDLYRIRLPFNGLSPPGRDYIITSVKAEVVNILAVNYGSPGACAYPRQLKLPFKWAFNSHTVLKDGEQAPRYSPIHIIHLFLDLIL